LSYNSLGTILGKALAKPISNLAKLKSLAIANIHCSEEGIDAILDGISGKMLKHIGMSLLRYWKQ
jgi:hypothetical protein